jgi:hypothetical protein
MKTKLFTLLNIFLLVAFAQAQVPQWKWAKGGGANGTNKTLSVTTDPAGNVIATGIFTDTAVTFGTYHLVNAANSNADMFVVKFDTAGNVLWAKSFGGIADDIANGIITDANGNIFITGSFNDTTIAFGTFQLNNHITEPATSDMFLAELSSNGTVVNAFSLGGNGNDEGVALAIDATGFVCIAGDYTDTLPLNATDTLINYTPGSPDIMLLKVNTTNQTVVWAKSGNGGFYDKPFSITVDAQKNIYMTGVSNSDWLSFSPLLYAGGGNQEAFTVKYNTNGVPQWVKGVSGSLDEQGTGIISDGKGNVVVCGYTRSATVYFDTTLVANHGDYDMFIVKYDTAGNRLWSKVLGSTGNDRAYALAADTGGSFVMGGVFDSPLLILDNDTVSTTGLLDMLVAKLDAGGNFIWTKQNGSTGDDNIYAVALSQSWRIALAGQFSSPLLELDSTSVIGGSGTTALIGQVEYNHTVPLFVPSVSGNSVSIYPVPFSNDLCIHLPAEITAQITLYDITGKAVLQHQLTQQETHVNCAVLSPGFYFAMFEVNGVRTVKQLIKQ